MIDTKELRRLAQEVSEWSNCNQAWLDQSEDAPAAVVGHIDEDGNTYPVATIDCDQYYAAHHSLPLAKFYAAANPAAISELLDRIEAAEKDITMKEEVIDSLGVVVKRLDAQCDAAEKAATEAYRRGYATGQEEIEKERDALRAKVESMESRIDWIQRALQVEARIEAMERQEPVAWLHESRRDSDVVTNTVKHVWGKAAVGSMAAYSIPLYALPGAKGE